MKEIVFLLLESGTPRYCAWGSIPADALKRSGKTTKEWSAVKTAWRRAPAFLHGGAARGLKVNKPVLDGRDLVVGGCRVSLDDPGRSRIKPGMRRVLEAAQAAGVTGADMDELLSVSVDTEQEPEAPEVTVEDEKALVATVEELGHEVRFVEKGSKSVRRVKPKGMP